MDISHSKIAVDLIYASRFLTILLGFAFAGAITRNVLKKPEYRIFTDFTRPERMLYAMLITYSLGVCGVGYAFAAFNRPIVGLSSFIPVLHILVLTIGFFYLRELSLQAGDARYEALIAASPSKENNA